MNRVIGAVGAIASTTGFAVASLGGSASAAVSCSEESYGQTAIFQFLENGSGAHDTGLDVPGPAANETLTVVSSTWTTYDYLDPESSPSRAEQNELNERVSLAVGGTQVGGLSTDLADSTEQGAPTDWSSGITSGSFGGAGSSVAGGSISLRHSSLFGFDDSANSFIVKSFSLTLERCLTTVETTTTTVAPTTTTPGVTTTIPAVTTTSVGAGAPTTTVAVTTTSVASAAPTTTIGTGSLPSTGGQMTLPLMLAALAGLTGTALLVVRRRPS